MTDRSEALKKFESEVWQHFEKTYHWKPASLVPFSTFIVAVTEAAFNNNWTSERAALEINASINKGLGDAVDAAKQSAFDQYCTRVLEIVFDDESGEPISRYDAFRYEIAAQQNLGFDGNFSVETTARLILKRMRETTQQQ